MPSSIVKSDLKTYSARRFKVRHLRPYQDKAVTQIYAHDRLILNLPMGAGKTVIMLTALQELLRDGVISKALILAPLRVAQQVWKQEAEAWAHTGGLRVSLVLGTAKQRQAALDTPADIYVSNFDNIQWLCDHWPKLNFECLVVDELTRLKNSSGKRFKALRKRLSDIPLRYGLTGTLISERLTDIFGQQFIIDDGEALGQSVERFRSRYFYKREFEYIPFPYAKPRILEQIAPWHYTIPDEDYTAQLPPIHYVPMYVTLPEDPRKFYRVLEDDLYHEAVGGVANMGVLVNKLQQVANGFIYNEERKPIDLHDEKVKALDEIVDETNDPLLVFYNYQYDLEMLRDRYPDAEYLAGKSAKKTDEICRRWNTGDIRILLGHPASMGHGLNLQSGGHTIVWYGLNWSLELMQQATARLHRSGQKYSVTVHCIMTETTVDRDIYNAWQNKKDLQDTVIEGLKSRQAD